MHSDIELANWLAQTNRRYRAEGIQHSRRPFVALCDFTREHQCCLDDNHPITKKIFAWFKQNSQPNVHEVGSAYTGVYFYDVAFWPVAIPFVCGRVELRAFDSLDTMPPFIKGELFASGQACIYGANLQILSPQPNVQAILGFRLAVEIFLKVILAQELNMDDGLLQRVGHRLESSAQACAEAIESDALHEVTPRLSVFPSFVSSRYSAPGWSLEEVWRAAAIIPQPVTNTVEGFGARQAGVGCPAALA